MTSDELTAVCPITGQPDNTDAVRVTLGQKARGGVTITATA
jgi:hypothetical protein